MRKGQLRSRPLLQESSRHHIEEVHLLRHQLEEVVVLHLHIKRRFSHHHLRRKKHHHLKSRHHLKFKKEVTGGVALFSSHLDESHDWSVVSPDKQWLFIAQAKKMNLTSVRLRTHCTKGPHEEGQCGGVTGRIFQRWCKRTRRW